MISLGSNGGVVALGGETAPPPYGGRVLMDLWKYPVATGWVQLGAPTLRTTDGPAVFDVQSNRLIVLGEIDVNFKNANENWIYDPTTNHWAKREPGDRPGSVSSVMAYDAESDRAILFNTDGQTWAYDFDTDTWTHRAPKSPPPARTWYALTYDEGLDRVVLFGGEAAGDLGDTWTYDDNTDTWKKMSPAKSPPARHYSSMAYDATSRRTVLFGGAPGSQNVEKPLCDTWAYDLAKNTWTQLSPPTSPSARGWHAMAFDAAIGKIVLFGGGADRNHFQNDTWLFDSSSNTWSRAS